MLYKTPRKLTCDTVLTKVQILFKFHTQKKMCSSIAPSPAHLHPLQVSYINKCTSCLKKEYVFCLKAIILSISRFTFFGIIYQFLKESGFYLLGNNVECLRDTYSVRCYLLQIALEFYHSSICNHFYSFFS